MLANLAYGARFGLIGEVISAWPAVAFLVSSEILIGMVRARGIPTRTEAAGTVAEDVPKGMPVNVPVIEPVAVPEPVSVDGVPPTPATVPGTVSARRARGRSSGRASKAPERIFAEEISRGELPSLRSIKSRAKCGTNRARVIRDQLAEILEAPEAA